MSGDPQVLADAIELLDEAHRLTQMARTAPQTKARWCSGRAPRLDLLAHAAELRVRSRRLARFYWGPSFRGTC